MPTTYPIHPGDRLQRRLVTVLSTSLTGSAFTGFSFVNDREEDEVSLPMIVVRQGESTNHPNTHFWHITMTVQMLEDRKEADDAISGDSRPRHELRTENISARLSSSAWNGSTLADAVNAISNGQGVHVLKIYGQNQASMNDIDMLSTEWTFTVICVATQQ